MQEVEAAKKRSARASQIIGSPSETISRDGVRRWLQELQGLSSAAAEEGAERLTNACGTGRSALSFDDLSSPAFDTELEKVLSDAKDSAAKAARDEMLRVKQAREERQLLVDNEARDWKPEQLNDDRDFGTQALSALAYLFPLVDSLFGAALADGSDAVPVLSSVISVASGPIFLLGQFPFGTQVLWFLLTLVASNRRLPRLLRFSIQQAVFLDLVYSALSVLASVAYFGSGGQGEDISAVFVLPLVGLFALVFLYAAASALAGREADGLPFLSEYTSEWIDGPPPPGFGSDSD